MHKDSSESFLTASNNIHQIIDAIPYAKLIGIECLQIGDSYIFKLPQNDDNIGNPTLPALHGGVIGGFLETAGIIHMLIETKAKQAPKVVDFSLDYISPGRDCDTYAKCTVVRQGKKIMNVSCIAFQKTEDKPIATARMNILM